MGKKKKDFNIIKDQEFFFNIQAKKIKSRNIVSYDDNFFKKEILSGLEWLKDCNNIIDYGCGEATTIDLFKKINVSANITGVDISVEAIKNSKKKYPRYNFIKISDNDLRDIQDNFYDGCYLIMVLHHSKNHSKIFNQIYKKLKSNGKFFICDLSSNNPFIKFGRNFFKYAPNYVKKKFEKEDLVINGDIPDKYPVDINKKISELKHSGFQIEKIGYGHLFTFLISWLNKFIPIFKFRFFRIIFDYLCLIENKIINTSIGKKKSEVFYIMCKK